jgi:hypothetical protein
MIGTTNPPTLAPEGHHAGPTNVSTELGNADAIVTTLRQPTALLFSIQSDATEHHHARRQHQLEARVAVSKPTTTSASALLKCSVLKKAMTGTNVDDLGAVAVDATP